VVKEISRRKDAPSRHIFFPGKEVAGRDFFLIEARAAGDRNPIGAIKREKK
jgi:hypothetical protein